MRGANKAPNNPRASTWPIPARRDRARTDRPTSPKREPPNQTASTVPRRRKVASTRPNSAEQHPTLDFGSNATVQRDGGHEPRWTLSDTKNFEQPKHPETVYNCPPSPLEPFVRPALDARMRDANKAPNNPAASNWSTGTEHEPTDHGCISSHRAADTRPAKPKRHRAARRAHETSQAGAARNVSMAPNARPERATRFGLGLTLRFSGTAGTSHAGP